MDAAIEQARQKNGVFVRRSAQCRELSVMTTGMLHTHHLLASILEKTAVEQLRFRSSKTGCSFGEVTCRMIGPSSAGSESSLLLWMLAASES